jgi:subfamily B ATP-binding cassette protein MsbA
MNTPPLNLWQRLTAPMSPNHPLYHYSELWPYIRPYQWRALLAVLLCIPIGSLDAVIALSLKPYMDVVLVNKEVASPLAIPFMIVGFTTLQGGLNYLATYMNTWVAIRITNDVKSALFAKLLGFETAFFDKNTSGDIVFRFNNDADMACSGLINNIKTFLSRLFGAISLGGVLFYNSWKLALIAIVVLGGALYPLTWVRKQLKELVNSNVIASTNIITAYNEAFNGHKTVTAYNLQTFKHQEFQQSLRNVFGFGMKMIQRTGWLSPLMHMIVSIGIAAVIGYGSFLIVNKEITSGSFVSFITALVMLYTPIKSLGNTFNAVQLSFLAIERIAEFLHRPTGMPTLDTQRPLESFKTAIELDNVCFSYQPDTPVLSNVSIRIPYGNTVALVGNSGGGKSTIASLLARFYDVGDGCIRIDGQDIREITPHSLRQQMAVVLQDNFLFSGSIRDNLLLAKPAASDAELQQAIEQAYLTDMVANLPQGLDTYIGERGVLLSGGQKQRVAIARAFLKNAPILILDEATSALDNHAEAHVQQALDALMESKTVVVIAHRLSTVRHADSIVVVNQGQIAEQGTHDALLNNPNSLYATLFHGQLQGNNSNPEASHA